MDTLKENKGCYASPRHRDVLGGLLAHPAIERAFFLTGGTALSVFYLHHRVSDDLDLFTLERESLSDLDTWIRARWKGSCSKIKEGPDFLSFLIDETKVEFVRDPLSNDDERPAAELEKGRRLKVDNLRNIVSNKLGAMVSRQEPKDFVDFYFIAKLNAGVLADIGEDGMALAVLGGQVDIPFGRTAMLSPEVSLLTNFGGALVLPGVVLNFKLGSVFAGLGAAYAPGDKVEGGRVLPKINVGYRGRRITGTLYIITTFEMLFASNLVGASIGYRF